MQQRTQEIQKQGRRRMLHVTEADGNALDSERDVATDLLRSGLRLRDFRRGR